MQGTELAQKLKYYQRIFLSIKKQLSVIVVGQDEIANELILAIMCNGHVLVEGVPGIGKTLTVKSLSKILSLDYKRIQFTPDLLPTDIIGLTTYNEKTGFHIVKGPIFTNFLLADEINRAPPKVQSALLEGMQERHVTIGKETHLLPTPFFVMATQNPLENLGTYSLPEAQIDRFMFKLLMTYPNINDEAEILKKNMTIFNFDDFDIKPVLNPQLIQQLQNEVKNVYTNPKVEQYIVRLVEGSRFPAKYGLTLGKYIQYGCSPRATIALFIASKANALLNGRDYVTPHDVKEISHITLRHRIILNYEGQANEITTDEIIDELLVKVPINN